MVKTADYYDRELDEVAFKTAKRNIGETPETRAKGLQILKNKLLSIDDLHPRLDDEFLLRFLRVAKFDASKSFERLRKYYVTKKKYANVFDKFYPSAAPSATSVPHFFVLPKRAEDGSVVVILKRGLFDPSKMDYTETFILHALILDYLVDNPVTQMCGATIILDFEGYSFQNFLQDTPSRIKMAVDTFQNTFPLRFRSIHVVNASPIFSLLYNLCYNFLSKKIRNRLHFHENNDGWKSLHDLIPADILTERYGGTVPDSEAIDLAGEVLKKDDYFKEQLKYGFFDKKRAGFLR